MSKYFTDAELACKCDRCAGQNNVGPGIAPRLYEVLDAIREAVGEPVYITSGYRCPEHNAEVGGVPDSQHVQGTAADIICEGIFVPVLASIAARAGADGIGEYLGQGFVHVDVRDGGANPGLYRWEG